MAKSANHKNDNNKKTKTNRLHFESKKGSKGPPDSVVHSRVYFSQEPGLVTLLKNSHYYAHETTIMLDYSNKYKWLKHVPRLKNAPNSVFD